MTSNLIQNYIATSSVRPQPQPIKAKENIPTQKPKPNFDIEQELNNRTFIKPLKGKGRLLNGNIFNAPAIMVKDAMYDVKAFKHAMSGKANAHSLLSRSSDWLFDQFFDSFFFGSRNLIFCYCFFCRSLGCLHSRCLFCGCCFSHNSSLLIFAVVRFRSWKKRAAYGNRILQIFCFGNVWWILLEYQRVVIMQWRFNNCAPF